MDSPPNTYFDLLCAYGAVWAIVVFYLVSLIAEQRKLRDEVSKLNSD